MSNHTDEAIVTELEWLKLQPLRANEFVGICQCGTERVIARSSDPKRMRASLLSLVFFDQFIYSNYREVYLLFRSKFPIPKLKAHASTGYASPSWFVYSYHGYDAQTDWELTSKIFGRCFIHAKQWLASNLNEQSSSFEENFEREVIGTFEAQHQDKFLSPLQNRQHEN